MGKILPVNVSRMSVLRYLRDVEHQVIDVINKEAEEDGKSRALNVKGISYMFDNICKHIHDM